MKTKKDLIIPFSFEKRRPINIEKFYLIPKNYENHNLHGLIDFKSIDVFGNDNLIFIEYCSGNGQWIIEKAKKNPNINWIAVEMKYERARKIWLKMHNENISNLLVIYGMAEPFTKYYIEESVISEVFINFPDPWPKSKHAKHRLFTSEFLSNVSDIVKKEGKATFATDDKDTSYRMIEAAHSSEKWLSTLQKPYYVNEFNEYGSSYFDTLWRSKNREIRYMQFSNIK